MTQRSNHTAFKKYGLHSEKHRYSAYKSGDGSYTVYLNFNQSERIIMILLTGTNSVDVKPKLDLLETGWEQGFKDHQSHVINVLQL
jgi:hypothetical protein